MTASEVIAAHDEVKRESKTMASLEATPSDTTSRDRRWIPSAREVIALFIGVALTASVQLCQSQLERSQDRRDARVQRAEELKRDNALLQVENISAALRARPDAPRESFEFLNAAWQAFRSGQYETAMNLATRAQQAAAADDIVLPGSPPPSG